MWELRVLFGLGIALSGVCAGWGLWAVSKIERARASSPRFILLASFSDTLLVVSILDIVYHCHLRPLLQS